MVNGIDWTVVATSDLNKNKLNISFRYLIRFRVIILSLLASVFFVIGGFLQTIHVRIALPKTKM
jgi:hypothetical protein